MLAQNKNIVIQASALILTPKEEFKVWIKKAALNEKIFPITVDKLVTNEMLANHAIAFITPNINSQEEAEKFYAVNDEIFFKVMLSVWPFSMKHFPEQRTHDVLISLFEMDYYFYLVDLLPEQKEIVDCSLMVIKPKEALKKWLDGLVENSAIAPVIEKSDLSVLRKIGISLLTPHFNNVAEETNFIEKNYSTLFEIGLTLYTYDKSQWPHDRSLENFNQWFDCVNYFPVIDLIKI